MLVSLTFVLYFNVASFLSVVLLFVFYISKHFSSAFYLLFQFNIFLKKNLNLRSPVASHLVAAVGSRVGRRTDGAHKINITVDPCLESKSIVYDEHYQIGKDF